MKIRDDSDYEDYDETFPEYDPDDDYSNDDDGGFDPAIGGGDFY